MKLDVSEKEDSKIVSKLETNAQMNVIYVPHVKIAPHYRAGAFGAKKEKNAFNFLHTLLSIFMVSVNPGSIRILSQVPKQCNDVNHVT